MVDVMHGGAAGLIFGMPSGAKKEGEGHVTDFVGDMCTTTALGPVAKPGYWE